MSEHLLATPRRLATASATKPRQADLKRAVSTAYYALFHAVAKSAADTIVGVGARRAQRAWTQVYRAIDHRFAHESCKSAARLGFPHGIVGCAEAFMWLQEARHSADYDPNHRVTRAEALSWVSRAEAAIRGLKSSPRKDRCAFAVLVMLKRR